MRIIVGVTARSPRSAECDELRSYRIVARDACRAVMLQPRPLPGSSMYNVRDDRAFSSRSSIGATHAVGWDRGSSPSPRLVRHRSSTPLPQRLLLRTMQLHKPYTFALSEPAQVCPGAQLRTLP